MPQPQPMRLLLGNAGKYSCCFQVDVRFALLPPCYKCPEETGEGSAEPWRVWPEGARATGTWGLWGLNQAPPYHSQPPLSSCTSCSPSSTLWLNPLQVGLFFASYKGESQIPRGQRSRVMGALCRPWPCGLAQPGLLTAAWQALFPSTVLRWA